jgi:hypothetical protein
MTKRFWLVIGAACLYAALLVSVVMCFWVLSRLPHAAERVARDYAQAVAIGLDRAVMLPSFLVNCLFALVAWFLKTFFPFL